MPNSNRGEYEMQCVRGLALMGGARYGSRWDDEDQKLWDFLAVFHPELTVERRQRMVRDARYAREVSGAER